MAPEQEPEREQEQETQTILAAGLDVALQDFSEIPLVDFAGFRDGSDRPGVAQAIGRAARDVGFLYVANHGVPETLLARTLDWGRRFFALPEAEKLRLYRTSEGGFRGYRAPFGQNYDPKRQLSYNENYFLWSEPPAGHRLADPDLPLAKPNLWPAGLPGFREDVEAYMAAALAFARQLMQAFALALGLPARAFEPIIDAPLGTLSFNHYPRHSGRIDHQVLGISEHSDYGLVTVLAQDEVPGLQVKNASGRWVAARPLPGTFVINLGHQMERLTNGLFKATAHRVVNASGGERYSLPFFLEPNWDAEIAVLEACQGPDHPPAYAPVLAGPYYLEILERSHAEIPPEMRVHAAALMTAKT